MAFGDRGIAAGAVAAVLVACSTFSEAEPPSADAGPGTEDADTDAKANPDARASRCSGHSLCQEFDGPLEAPWTLSGSATVVDGSLEMSIPGGPVMPTLLKVEFTATRAKCEVTIQLGKLPAVGSVFLFGLETDVDQVYVGASVSANAVVVRQGVGGAGSAKTEATGTALAADTRVTFTLEAGAGMATSYTQAKYATQTGTDKLAATKITGAFFGLKPDNGGGAATDAWTATFDDIYCDIITP